MKRLRFLVMSGAMCLAMAGCSDDEPQVQGNSAQSEENTTKVQSASTESPSQSAKVTVKDQTFHILSLHDEVLDYASTVKDDSSAVKKEVYTEKVVQPLQEQIAELDVNIYADPYSFLSPNTNIQKLEENTKKLIQDQDRIQGLVEEAIEDSAAQLAGVDKTIIILPVNPDELFVKDKMEGVTGVALSENIFVIRIDPSFKEEALKYTVAHEYHHTLQAEKRAGVSHSYLETFVLEGKADAFANMVYPDQQAPWTEPLSERLQEKVFEELREAGGEFDRKTYYEFFNGDSGKGIPLWSNYKTGYLITQSYLENNPEVSIKEWTGLIPKEIILGSDYKELFQELEE
ncbi:DUF2268 domain-containing putative Zn-dependent protease [Bacillus sp. AK031]